MQIRLENISKRYPNNIEAVKNISFEIKENEFLVLVGPSGCGKSTILRMIAGLEEITSGNLYFDDKLMNSVEPAKRNVGMVFQSYALYPHFSVYKNLAFPLIVQKVSKELIDTKVKEVAKLLGLQDFLNFKPKELSGGQRQRVALGRALIKQPQVFLFDEPLSNIDAHLRQSLRTEILELQRQYKIPSLYVTHDQTEAMTMGDRIVVLKDGTIQQIASPEELYNYPKNLFVASFIGSPKINIFKGTACRNEQIEFTEKETGTKFILSIKDETLPINKIETICIRPEHFSLKVITEEAYSFPAIVRNVEYLGFDLIVHFHILNDKNLRCLRTTEKANFNINETIRIYYCPEKFLLYDAEGNLLNNH